MSFLVFEPDPIVQSDIAETLAGAFQDHAVHLFDSVLGLLNGVADLAGQAVAIISNPTMDDIDRVISAISRLENVRVILLGDRNALPASPNQHFYDLPLPFSSSMLVSTVRNALSDLP